MLKKTGFISQEQKEQILKSIDIVQLISDYVILKPSGKNFIGLCPFHQEKTPSFTVSPSYQNYKCYGCGESGDSIRFIMGLENLPFLDAVRFLAQKSGIQLQLFDRNEDAKPVKSDIDQCLEESLAFFRKTLTQSAESSRIKRYLMQRHFANDLVERFELGYVEQGWQNLNQYLVNRSISIDTQEKAGLIKKGEKGGFYDRLRDRLIFPIRDKNGRLIGFAGRAIGDDLPKYLNPPETDLYKKSAVFYGIEKAVQQIRRRRRVILVEGYLDVMRMHEHGWQETVATCGTAITATHIEQLKKLGAEEAILIFDGDAAGIKAAERSARLFIENDLDSKVVVLPEGMDPDDYFQSYSNDAFKALVENAAYDFEFIISHSKKKFATKGIEFQEKQIKEVIGLAANIRSTVKKDLFFAKAAELYAVNRRELQQLFSQSQKPNKEAAKKKEDGTVQGFAREHLPEIRFLQYLINHVQAIKTVRPTVSTEDFINEDLSEIYARFLQLSDEEFTMLKAEEFPEIFVEHSSLLMQLLHYESEYQGPASTRPSSDEMMKLKSENEKLIQDFSQKTLDMLIKRLKSNKKSYEIKRMRFLQPDQVRETLQELIKNRKKGCTEQ